MPGLGVVRGLAHLNLHWMKYMVFTGESLNAKRQGGGAGEPGHGGGRSRGAAEDLARKIAKRAPLALAVGKQILNRHADEGYGHGIEAISLLQGTADVRRRDFRIS